MTSSHCLSERKAFKWCLIVLTHPFSTLLIKLLSLMEKYRDKYLSYRADWLAWIGISIAFGSGEGLLSTEGGVSVSSRSSIGSSFITGGGKEQDVDSDWLSVLVGALLGGATGLQRCGWILEGVGECKCMWLLTLLLLFGLLAPAVLLWLLLPWKALANGVWLFKVPW